MGELPRVKAPRRYRRVFRLPVGTTPAPVAAGPYASTRRRLFHEIRRGVAA
jgi:hypothetical protein